MNTTTNLLIGGVVVIGGRWSQGKPLDVKVGVGLGLALLLMSVGENYAPTIVGPLSVLFLVTALLVYGVPLFQGLAGEHK